MNQVPEEKKEAVTKILAIAGFAAILLFSVWLAIQVVNLLPNAISSLASLADSVYNYEPNEELQVATENSVINAGESFEISWTQMRNSGSYTFEYACVDGVSVEIKNQEGAIMAVACDTEVELNTATSLQILVASEKDRFIDLPYTITFTPEKGDSKVTNARVTIVNASIPTNGLAQSDESEEEDEEETDDQTPTVQTPSTPSTPTYVAGTPTTVTKLIYSIPTSNPKGSIDLEVKLLGVGTLSGKTFTASDSIDIDKQGAIQFEVKNIGTKTAEDWEYKAELPGDITYTSKDQKALKPNERAVITLGFEGITKDGKEKISVNVDAEDDVKKSNDSFTKTIKLVD